MTILRKHALMSVFIEELHDGICGLIGFNFVFAVKIVHWLKFC